MGLVLRTLPFNARFLCDCLIFPCGIVFCCSIKMLFILITSLMSYIVISVHSQSGVLFNEGAIGLQVAALDVSIAWSSPHQMNNRYLNN